MVLDADGDVSELGFDGTCDIIRAWLRVGIAERLRRLAETDPIAFPCPGCGEDVEVSPSYYEKVRAGSVPAPLCFECKRPRQVAQAEAEAARFIELLASEQLAAAVAALR